MQSLNFLQLEPLSLPFVFLQGEQSHLHHQPHPGFLNHFDDDIHQDHQAEHVYNLQQLSNDCAAGSNVKNSLKH